MEQFRQLGEVLGSVTALMVLKHEIQINQRQCCLLLDMYNMAFNMIGDMVRLYLRSDEKSTKWKALEQPLKELHRVFKEGELYVRRCLDNKDWWAKVIALHQNKDCVEFHIHNLLCYFPSVIEAIEAAGEISGLDPDEMQRRRVALGRKYDKEWNDPKIFQLRFGKEYLISREICSRFESAYKEDKWLLVESLMDKKRLGSVVLTTNEQKLVDMLLRKLNGDSGGVKLYPSSILLGGKDYQVRRRLGGGSEYKEIQWLGDSFAMRRFYGETELLTPEISTLLSLSHPNILQYFCGFCDKEKKEFFLVMELMNKDLSCYIRENSGSRRQVLFSFSVVVDLMLQIARGMEYLHSRKIYHGDLNPSNIFLKPRSSTEGFYHAKVSGFGLSSIKVPWTRNPQPESPSEDLPIIWYAPEVLAELEQTGGTSTSKFSEKADVYSFGMLCFEILTGKVPFEHDHLQGENMTRNILLGGRPLFPSDSPKYLVNLTRKCWHISPSQRPSFSSITRVLRFIKKFHVMNPHHAQSFQSPLIDYCDIEAGFVKKFIAEGSCDGTSVSEIPFQMFAYRMAEKEKTSLINKDKHLDLSGDAAYKDEFLGEIDDDFLVPANETRSAISDVKSVCFDMRSVYSEDPGKRISNFDMRSVCSEYPSKRMSSSTSILHSPITPRKNISRRDVKTVYTPKTLEKRIQSYDTRSYCSSDTRECSPRHPKLVGSKSMDKKLTSPLVSSKSLDKKMAVIKKPVNAKVKKASGPMKSGPAKPSSSSAAATHTAQWKPCGRTRTSQETRR